jgi:type IV pilus assembly protein PilZ
MLEKNKVQRGRSIEVEGPGASGAERRVAERVFVDMEVDYASDDTFLFAYARNISSLGIFLQTNEPKPPGTHLNLRFSSPQTGERLEVEGVVRWINPFRPGDIDNINPGMGIEFLNLTDEQRESIVDLVRLIAYLADDDAPALEDQPQEQREPALDPRFS